MAITINRSGLEIEAGPLSIVLSLAVQGLAWEGLFDVVMDGLCASSSGRLLEARRTAPGWFEIHTPWRRLSIQLGHGWRTAAA